MATKTETAWNNVYSILDNARATTLSYVKSIYQGIRDIDDIVAYPCIVLEPVREDESQITVPNHKKILFNITIACLMQVLDKDKQIIGDKDNIGILDFARDVKNVLSQYRDLNGSVLKFDFLNTNYIYEIYPFRSAEITMQMELITLDTER